MEMKEEIKKEHFESREHLKAREYANESTSRPTETTSTDCISYEYLSSCYNLDDYQYEVEFSEFLPDYKISFDDLTSNFKSPALSSSSSSSTSSSLSLSLDFNFNKPQFFNHHSNVNCREVSNLANCMTHVAPHCAESSKHFLMINSNQMHSNIVNTYPAHCFNSNYKQDVSVGTEFSTNYKYGEHLSEMRNLHSVPMNYLFETRSSTQSNMLAKSTSRKRPIQSNMSTSLPMDCSTVGTDTFKLVEKQAKKTRTKYNKEQIEMLELAYLRNAYPDVLTVENLCKSIGIKREKVNIWFQNRRARSKRTAQSY